jgi:hypothetical protein
MNRRLLARVFAISLTLVTVWLFGYLLNTAPAHRFAGESSPTGISALFEPLDVAYARRLITPEIRSKLQLIDEGRAVEVVGHITCPEGESFTVRTVVTDSTGQQAEEQTEGVCTGEKKQTWIAYAEAPGTTSLEEGWGEACGWASWPSLNGTYNWCVRTRLKE